MTQLVFAQKIVFMSSLQSYILSRFNNKTVVQNYNGSYLVDCSLQALVSKGHIFYRSQKAYQMLILEIVLNRQQRKVTQVNYAAQKGILKSSLLKETK